MRCEGKRKGSAPTTILTLFLNSAPGLLGLFSLSYLVLVCLHLSQKSGIFLMYLTTECSPRLCTLRLAHIFWQLARVRKLLALPLQPPYTNWRQTPRNASKYQRGKNPRQTPAVLVPEFVRKFSSFCFD